MCCEIRTCLFLYIRTLLCRMFGKFALPWTQSWRSLRKTVLSLSPASTMAGPAPSDSWHHRLSPRTPVSSSLCCPKPTPWPLPPLPWHTGYFCDSEIRLCLKHLIFSLETRDIWSTKEIVQRFLHLHRNLVWAPNFLVPFKISRHERSINLNSLRK